MLEEIARSDSKHFLILFRDAGCQFRALYSFCPEREELTKLYGTGPKQVNDTMFDKFFKYVNNPPYSYEMYHHLYFLYVSDTTQVANVFHKSIQNI